MNISNTPQQLKSSVSRKRIALAMLLFIPAILLIALPFYQPEDLPYLLLQVGRFHPVILHFPIVLIIVVLVLELMRRSDMLRKADYVITIILVAAVLSTVVAIASGFLLYASGDYSGALPEQHLWIGVITGVGIFATAAFYFLKQHVPKLYSLYLGGLLVSSGAVAYASHLGGALTHGEDYLTEYLPLIVSKTTVEPPKAANEMLVYDDMIVPVFEAKCVSCHNESRSKGEFSMTSFEQIAKGGESEQPGIVKGNADSSELYRRVVLPEGHDDRMPPEGKAPFTDAETALLKFWIQSGADMDLKVDEAKKDSNVNQAVSEIMPALKRYRRKQEVAKLKTEQLERELQHLAMKLNIIIERDSTADENLYTVAMRFPPASFTTEQFRELAPYANVFSKLSLVSSGVEDDGLYHISKMENLKELYLQKTAITGSGIIFLKKLDKLEVLNLSYTKVDDKSAIELLHVPNLREVYLFQTNTSAEVAKALQGYRPSMSVLLEEGPYF